MPEEDDNASNHDGESPLKLSYAILIYAILSLISILARGLRIALSYPTSYPLHHIFYEHPTSDHSAMYLSELAYHNYDPEDLYNSTFPAHIFTVYAVDSTTSSSTEAPLLPQQHKYTGQYVIPNSLADQPCESLSVKGLLSHMNNIMGTLYPLEGPLETLLQGCLARDTDFGMAYSRLRPYWRKKQFSTLEGKLERAGSRDRIMRAKALDSDGSHIVCYFVPPRRLWDLHSNRIVPWWYSDLGWHFPEMSNVWPVSHAWVAQHERESITTRINGGHWPVPIPRDSNLGCVRIELLNLGAKYAWLDVLCLRQEGRLETEDVRREEWKLDVPTIGDVYYRSQELGAKMMVYFNGLGRPFEVGDLESERHWLNRVWTLQEVGKGIIAGGANQYILDINMSPYQGFTRQFRKTVELRQDDIFVLIHEVLRRYPAVEREVDRVACLASLVRRYSNSAPTYSEDVSLQDAWEQLLKVMSEWWTTQLLFVYPVPGDSHVLWAPSWSQLIGYIPDETPPMYRGAGVRYNRKTKSYDSENIYVRDITEVVGLDSPSRADLPIGRLGQILIPNQSGHLIHIPVLAKHSERVDRSVPYVLLLPQEVWGNPIHVPCVVGKRDEAGRVRKMCVVWARCSDYGMLCNMAKRGSVTLL